MVGYKVSVIALFLCIWRDENTVEELYHDNKTKILNHHDQPHGICLSCTYIIGSCLVRSSSVSVLMSMNRGPASADGCEAFWYRTSRKSYLILVVFLHFSDADVAVLSAHKHDCTAARPIVTETGKPIALCKSTESSMHDLMG